MKIHPDNAIVRKLRYGDRLSQDSVLTKIYKDNYRMIEKYILQNSGNKEEAQDVFQDGIIVFYNQCKKESFLLSASLRTYLYAVCRNLWLSKLNRENRTLELKDENEMIGAEDIGTEELERNEKNRALSKIINRLGDNCQKVLCLFYFEKHPMKSIANNMGFANKDVAKSKKYKCLQKLRLMVSSSTYIANFLK